MDLRRLAPVIRVTLQLDPVALHPVLEHERAGADRLLLDVADALRGDDHRVPPGHVEEEITLRGGQGHLDLKRADNLDILDPFEKPLLRILTGLIPCPVQGELDVLGVKLGAVMEGHPGT